MSFSAKSKHPLAVREYNKGMAKLQKSDTEWKEQLSDEQYQILRRKGTEAPFSGKFNQNKDTGTYVCAACGNPLFSSDTKFDSKSGWPSFYDAIAGSVEFHDDSSHGMARTEITCANCGGHLGHIFNDAVDQPTGQRYCINSVSLDFKPKV